MAQIPGSYQMPLMTQSLPLGFTFESINALFWGFMGAAILRAILWLERYKAIRGKNKHAAIDVRGSTVRGSVVLL